MTATQVDASRSGRASRYVVLLIGVWMAVTAARLYPQFDTAVRIDGRVTTVNDYLVDRCGARLGPAAETCLAAAERNVRIQLRREQAKSVLIVVAPAVLYLAYLAFAAAAESHRQHLDASRKAAP